MSTSIASVITQIGVLLDRISSGHYSHADAAATYEKIEQLRRLADGYERNLIRGLKWDATGKVVHTWKEVGDMTGGQFSGRHGPRQRWKRLTAPTRRTTTGDHRAGAAIPRAVVQ